MERRGVYILDITVVHLKLFDQNRNGYVMVSIRGNGELPDPHGDLIADCTTEHQLGDEYTGTWRCGGIAADS